PGAERDHPRTAGPLERGRLGRHPDQSAEAPNIRMTVQDMLLVFGVLIGGLARIGAAARFLRFRGWRAQPRSERTLILRESIALDPRRRIHLVQCGQRQVILRTGGGQDLVVRWLPETR